MSFVFDVGDDTVWSPSLRVGQIFTGYVQVLEGVTGVTAGLSFISSDYVEIDPLALTEFRQALIPLISSANPLLHGQVNTVFAIVEVLLERAGAASWDSASLDDGMVKHVQDADDAMGR